MTGRLVRPGFGPTLLELARRWGRAAQAGLLAAGALLVAGLVFVGLGGASARDVSVVVRTPRAFNFAHAPRLEAVARPGTLAAVEDRRGSLFVQGFAVRALTLPPYRGAASGTLPVYADGYLRALRERYTGLHLVAEGKARVNAVPGYQVVFRARLGRRLLYGRHILLLPDVDGAREGVVLELEATPASGTPNAGATGAVGGLKKALRTFRFGTERVGGE